LCNFGEQKHEKKSCILLSIVLIAVSIYGSAFGAAAQLASYVNFGPNVLIFDSKMPMDQIQQKIDEVFNQIGGTEFGTQRYALAFKPGNYSLDVKIGYYMQAIGLGLATLMPDNGTPAMVISDVDGVKVAGIIFDAGTTNSPSLLQVGEPGGSKSHSANPTSIHDIFCRLGNNAPGLATTSLIVNSKNVIGDHAWLWRADHGRGSAWDSNKGKNGLIVNADDVAFYGLFVEHYQEFQTIWNGNGGRVYFYQCEMPYAPPDSGSMAA
jgi:hypothetical protein